MQVVIPIDLMKGEIEAHHLLKVMLNIGQNLEQMKLGLF
jgi:hypothetical protein